MGNLSLLYTLSIARLIVISFDGVCLLKEQTLFKSSMCYLREKTRDPSFPMSGEGAGEEPPVGEEGGEGEGAAAAASIPDTDTSPLATIATQLSSALPQIGRAHV